MHSSTTVTRLFALSIASAALFSTHPASAQDRIHNLIRPIADPWKARIAARFRVTTHEGLRALQQQAPFATSKLLHPEGQFMVGTTGPQGGSGQGFRGYTEQDAMREIAGGLAPGSATVARTGLDRSAPPQSAGAQRQAPNPQALQAKWTRVGAKALARARRRLRFKEQHPRLFQQSRQLLMRLRNGPGRQR